MDDFYIDETSSKSKVIKILIALLIVACCVLLAFYLQNKNTFKVRKEIKVEVGTKLSKDVDYYVKSDIKSSKDYKVTVEGLTLGKEITKTGKYTYRVTYNKKTLKGTLNVVDTTSPTVEVEDLTVGVDEEYSLDDFVTSCIDYSKPCNVTTKNESDETLSEKAGNYKINLIITDQAGNKVNKKVTLTVKEGYSREEEYTSDLTIAKIDPSYDDYNNKAFITFDKAFNPDDLDDEGYEYLYETLESDLSIYIPSEYVGTTITNQEIIYLYNKYGYIVGISVRVKLSNGVYTYLTK